MERPSDEPCTANAATFITISRDVFGVMLVTIWIVWTVMDLTIGRWWLGESVEQIGRTAGNDLFMLGAVYVAARFASKENS